MNKTLALSLGLNAVLMSGLVLLWSGPTLPRNTAPVVANSPVAAPVAAAPLPMAGFHWSDLESEDYPAYVAHLRSIGCPESTLRSILKAEIEEASLSKRRELAAHTPAAALAAALEKLAEENARLVESFLAAPGSGGGASAGSGSENTASPAAQNARSIRVNPGPPVMPLIFQLHESKGLNDAQQASIERLRKDFMEAIGGENQDTHDPAYLKRWREAQARFDEQTAIMLGSDELNRLQIEASRSSAR